MLRDKIVSIFITDPVKQVEFNLLTADKQLNMGIFLSEKGKEELAQKTVLGSEKHLYSAAEQFVVIAGKEEGVGVLQDQLKRSVLKHKEVVTQLKNKAASEYKTSYQEALDLIQKSQEKLQGL